MTLEDIRDRIAELMKWSRKDVDKFSLPQLREFVKGKDEKLDHVLSDVIETKQHFFIRE